MGTRETEARCLKSNTWSTPPSQGDCSRPGSCHVAVMLLLDASTIARNVGHDLIFATSCRTHSDLGGCADSVADALPARQNTRLCCWHACASVWIATSFRPRPRMHDMTCPSPNTTTNSTTGWPLLSGRTNAAASQRPYQRSAARLPMRVRRAATSGTPTAPRGRAKAWHSSLCSVRETCRTPVLPVRRITSLGARGSPPSEQWITSVGAHGSPPSERMDHLPRSAWITSLGARGSR